MRLPILTDTLCYDGRITVNAARVKEQNLRWPLQRLGYLLRNFCRPLA